MHSITCVSFLIKSTHLSCSIVLGHGNSINFHFGSFWPNSTFPSFHCLGLQSTLINAQAFSIKDLDFESTISSIDFIIFWCKDEKDYKGNHSNISYAINVVILGLLALHVLKRRSVWL